MKRIKSAFAIYLLLLTTSQLLAQNEKIPLTYGAYGGLNINFHSPDFRDPNTSIAKGAYRVDTTSRFSTNSTSIGLAIGGIVNYTINDVFQLSGRLGFNGMGTTITSQNRRYNGTDTTNVNSEIDASLGAIEVSPVMRAKNLFGTTPLNLLGGFEFSIPILTSYTHVDRTSDGKESALLNNQSSHDRVADPLASFDAGFRAALVLGADYDIPITKSVTLSPEITFRMPFTTVSTANAFDSWSVSQLRVGVSVTFGNNNNIKDNNEPSVLDVRMDNVGYYTNDGVYNPVNYLKVEDIAYSELYPLVPYLFFTANDKKPVETEYTNATGARAGGFTLTSLQPDAVDINKNILDIVGYRLKQYPDSKLTITGTTDGKTESKNVTVAKERADFAKSYLTSTYGIDESRLNVVARGLPAKPSANTVPDAEAENRRVEFSSTTPELLSPIVIKSDNQRIAYPELIEFRPFTSSNKGVSEWNLHITQAGKALRSFSGVGTPTPMRWQIRPNELSNSQINVEYLLTVTDSSGLKKEVYGSIPVEYLSSTKKRTEQLADKSVSKFSLILFDFDKAELNEENTKIVEENVVPAIQYNSTVTIIGYSDALGDANYNQKLSQKRADVVKKVLETKVRDAKYSAKGVGENVPIFDNNSVIGRHLSRTVQIIVETPKK